MKFPIFRKKIMPFLLPALFLLIVFALFAGSRLLTPTDTESYHTSLLEKMETASSFSDFTSYLFRYEVTTDSITTAYNLRQPSSYDIPELPAVLSDFSVENYEKSQKNQTGKKTLAFLSDCLNHFSYSGLSSSEQITYTLLKNQLELNTSLTDYPYYEELLGSTTGVQANLPVTLAEYPLPDEGAVVTYLNLLTQVPDYFDNVICYEKNRNKTKLQTPDFILTSTKKEMTSLINSLKQEENCLTSTFKQRLASIEGLSAKKRKQYEEQNQRYVKKYVLSAYESLYEYVDHTLAAANKKSSSDASSSEKTAVSSNAADTASVSESQSRNSDSMPQADTAYGLSSVSGGADYYSLLVRSSTGSNRSVSELIAMTESSLEQALGNVMNVALTDQEAYLYYCEHPMETYYETPSAILEALSLMIREDYPVLSKTPSYQVKTVPESLASSLSPAFYMIPAIDDYNTNTIYINPLYTNEENGNLFTTLAHEGFPGHLYQTVYFNSTDPDPIRQMLDYPGYVEGWATYVEMDAFTFLEYPLEGDSLCRLYQSDTIISLALCSRIDLGVNYENWTLNDTCKFFEDNGFNSYYASDVYSYVVEAPANYLSYFIGYLEIENLKTAYKNLKMEEYSEKEFHKALLDIGPADFDTIRKSLLSTP
ncbi:MAG: DUF885 domain-containing protein [Lachnospiraceae bacterium]